MADLQVDGGALGVDGRRPSAPAPAPARGELASVMPGDVRPSSWMQALPWMIRPTPARAFGTKALAYASAASGPSPAPSRTGAR